MYGKPFLLKGSLTILLLLTLRISNPVGAVSLNQPVLGASGVDLDTFYDNYNDNSIDTSLWGRATFDGSDSLVTVNETGGQLVITPRANQTGQHFNGLLSSRTYNFTRGSIFVEVVESSRNQAQTLLMFGTDAGNRIMMNTESDRLHMSLVVGGTRTGAVSIPYDSVAHRWWRIRHVASGDTIRFDTSIDGIVWTQRHSLVRGSLNITSGKVNLSAGTWNSQSSPGRAVFDNLSWHPLVPNKGDWSTPTTAISPNPTPGTWDHILYGAASPSTMVKFNGTYFLYYIGAKDESPAPEYNPIQRSLGVATSSDGIRFTKYSANPIISYTTTNGSVIEEGVGGATAIVVGNTIHLYYAAIRSTGGENVDLDIRYRKSIDGFNFTNDALIYRSAGDEYAPLGVTLNGGVWSVYIKGPLNGGKGPLSRLWGTSPVSLPNKATVTSTTFGSGGNANYISGNVFVVHLDRRETTEDRFQVRAINTGSPNTIGEPLFSYTFGNFSDHATPATFRDDATGKWFMYTLNLSVSPVVISVRTHTPSQFIPPTSIVMPTSTRTATLLATITRTPLSVTPTRTPTLLGTATRTPTRTPTLLGTVTRTPTRTPTLLATVTRTPTTSSAGLHIGDLDGTTATSGADWSVKLTITVHNSNHSLVPNATVSGTWTNAPAGNRSCVTNTSGVCSLNSGWAASGSTSITFTVTNISHPTLPYISANNHDPDGSSNGRVITIQKP